MSKPALFNGLVYSEFFALLPFRVDSGSWVWLTAYYMRPNGQGHGVTFTFSEALLDSYSN